MTKKHAGGRPVEFVESTVDKLRQAFAIGCTVIEACIYADIDKSTFYKHVKQGSELYDKLMALRDRPVLKARQTVVSDLGTVDTAFKYLKSHRKDEFSERNELNENQTQFIINLINYGRGGLEQIQKLGQKELGSGYTAGLQQAESD